MTTPCPCGSQQGLENCCMPYIKGRQVCPTAEALMRSRYTAYTLGEMNYIFNTHDVSSRQALDFEATKQWARRAQWKGLQIINVVGGVERDKTGSVEFKAFYRLEDEDHVLHEVSQFLNKSSRWFYTHGSSPSIKQYTREAPKIGRNDPCSCGSGKKYKKCCGK